MEACVLGVGVRGPGLEGWQAARPVLAGAASWAPAEMIPPPPALLPANERRRAGDCVRLALLVAEEAVRMAGLELDAVRGVFGSANGEGAILHGLLETLATDAPLVSPTQFHNSVHNAVAGYWAMGARSRQAMTCVAAHRETVAAALLKALAEVASEREAVLLCVYDTPMPEPLGAKQPTEFSFACALVLAPAGSERALAVVRASWQEAEPRIDSRAADGLALLEAGNPAARSLPLLQAIASGRRTRLALGLLGGAVSVHVEPCSTAPPSPP